MLENRNSSDISVLHVPVLFTLYSESNMCIICEKPQRRILNGWYVFLLHTMWKARELHTSRYLQPNKQWP